MTNQQSPSPVGVRLRLASVLPTEMSSQQTFLPVTLNLPVVELVDSVLPDKALASIIVSVKTTDRCQA